jgi:hypothetical protein
MAVAAIAAATVIAACGSNSSGSNSSGSTSSSARPTAAQVQQAQQDAVRFSQCMRGHGVANFPDPSAPHEFKSALDPSTAHTPAFHSAIAACQHLLPNGGHPSQSAAHSQAQIASFLAFARCLRGHGFPSFPDPTSSGELSAEMLANAGINLHQPAVVQAADACVGVTHGVVTRADVARFVAEH